MLELSTLYSSLIGGLYPTVINHSLWSNVGFLGVILLLMLLVTYLIYKNSISRKKEQESLRRQIAQDFHDEMGSKLSVISMYSELTKTQIDSGNEKANLFLDKIADAANGLYGSMKDLLWALDPTQDTLGDLTLRLKETGEELFGHSNIGFETNYQLKHAYEGLLLPLDYKRQIGLIFKEAMNNSLKHAKGCTKVELRFQIKKNHIIIRLRDNGNGFDKNEEQRGEGLKNMESRAEKLKGDWQLKSSEKGTVASLTLPLNPFRK